MNIEIKEYTKNNLKTTIQIWNEVVEDGVAFPQEELLTEESGKEFFRAQTYSAVAKNKESGEVYEEINDRKWKMKTYINKSNDEIIKKHIANMNEFCIENIDFEQGKEQLQMIYRYYVKRFSSDEISYKNLIILKDEMSRDVNIGENYNKNTSHWMKYFVSCSGSEWKELWQAL